jgi:hypothetical protein
MTDPRPGGGARPFGPGELGGVPGIAPDELAGEAAVARELEAFADRTRGGPTGDFVDRVMTAVTAEPMAAPAKAAGIALRRGAFGAFLASLGDAWRVTTRPGFPMAVRAQALALVLLVAGLAAGSGLATAGAIGLLDDDRGGPSPHPSLLAPAVDTDVPSVVEPTPVATSEDTSPEPSQTAEPAETRDDATAEPTHSPEPADTGDKGGDHHGAGGAGSPTSRPARTPRPTPTQGDDSGDHHDGGGGEDGSETPEPTETAAPGETPDGSSGNDSSGLSGHS